MSEVNLGNNTTSNNEDLIKKDRDIDTESRIKQFGKLNNSFQSYFSTLKIFIGNTFLTIPVIFCYTGWLGGILLYGLIALLSLYTMSKLIEVTEY
jgi:hypothetical protein